MATRRTELSLAWASKTGLLSASPEIEWEGGVWVGVPSPAWDCWENRSFSSQGSNWLYLWGWYKSLRQPGSPAVDTEYICLPPPIMRLIYVIYLAIDAISIVTSNWARLFLSLFKFLSGRANANVHSIFERIQKEEIWFQVFRLAALNTVQNTAVERVDEVQLVGAGSGLHILKGKRIFWKGMFQINLLLI